MKGGKGRLLAAFYSMSKIVGRIKQGDLLLAGELNERRPVVSNGLLFNYPMDGSLNRYQYSPAGLRVLYQSSSNTAGGYEFTKWLSANGATVTQSTDLTTVTVATAQTYDLIIADFSVWGVSSAIISQLKTFTDNGVSCVAMGNDTTTNVFVAAMDTTGTKQVHDIIIDPSYPTYTSQNIYTGVGSSDVAGGIQTLQGGARPLYYRADVQTQISGYYYESISGAVFYFDQEGVALQEYMKNMALWAASRTTASANASNVVWTEDGASISRASSNLIQTIVGADAFFNTSTGWNLVNDTNYTSAIEHPPGAIYGNGNALRVSDNDGNTGTSEWGGVSMSAVTGLTAQTYTMSIRFKVVGWTTGTVAVWSHQQNSSGTDAPDDYGLPNSMFDGEWHTYSVTRTQGSGNDKRSFSIGMDKTNLGCTIYVDAIQFEAGGFLTSFENGSGGDTTLQLFNGVPVAGSWTVAFDYYHSDLSSFAQNMVFASSYDGTNSGAAWFGLTSGTNKINAFGGAVTSPNNQWNNAIFTFDGSITTLYLNGVQSGLTYSGELFFTKPMMSFSPMIGWGNNTYLASCKIRDYSAWNRVLTIAEIQKIAKPSFSLLKDGSVSTNVKERSNSTSYNNYYFPFGNSAMDSSSTIIPTTESNVLYQDGAVWVGKSIANVYTGEYGGAGGVTVDNGWYKKTTTGNFRAYVTLSSLVNATTYACAATIYNPTNSAIVIGIDWCDVTSINNTIQPFETKRVKVASSYSTYDSTYRFFDINMTTGAECWIKDIQIEQSNFSSPYVGSIGGSRSQGRIELPGSLVTGNMNLAFSMWARSDGFDNTYNMPFDAYPHVYVAMRDTHQLHFSFIDNGSQVSIGPTGTLVQGQWHHIAGIKTAAGFTMFLDGKQIGSHTPASGGTGYVSTIDGDGTISIGCYDTSYPLDGYVKDLIIESGTITLTAAKISDIYKTQIRAYKDNRIQVQGQVREGKVL